MKLFRTIFWLGVVIYNLPNSPVSNPARPASQPQGIQSWAAKAAGQFCPQPLEFCAKTVEAQPKRGDLGGHNSSRDASKPSQDTLVPADRVWPWRGSGLHAVRRSA
jgi:hypothetical protein